MKEVVSVSVGGEGDGDLSWIDGLHNCSNGTCQGHKVSRFNHLDSHVVFNHLTGYGITPAKLEYYV